MKNFEEKNIKYNIKNHILINYIIIIKNIFKKSLKKNLVLFLFKNLKI